jgi:hypothetical protein
MSTHVRPRRLERSIHVQRVGEEVLLYDEQRHEAFCLNPTSAAVWDLATGRNTVADISRAASLALGTPVPEPVVEFALAGLREQRLLQDPPILQPAVSRRAMMRSLGATSLLLVPVVAAIVAPKAAQAYTGCFNCPSSVSTQRRAAAQRAQQQADAAANKSKWQQLEDGQLF